MKSLLKNTALNSFSIFVLSQIFEGVKITEGLPTLVLAGIVLTLMTIVVKPILSLITLPLNIITFGMFSFLINSIILYLLTILIPQIKISAFIFQGFSFLGFVVPEISLNNLFAYIVCGFVLSGIISFISWLTKD